MAVAEPVELYHGWNAGSAAPSLQTPHRYAGRHRRRGGRSWSLRRMFYLPRHACVR